MKYYQGTERAYIFADYPESYAGEAEKILAKIMEKRILFSRPENGIAGKKEEERVRRAHAVLLFADREFMGTERFRKIVDIAVESGRSILVVYLDGAGPFDNWSHMQLDPAQALWRDRFPEEEAFFQKLLEAEIFRNMAISPKQEKIRRRRSGWLRLLLLAAFAVLFVRVLWPKAVAPGIEQAKKEAEAKEAALKNGPEKLFSVSQLQSIQQLSVFGDRVPGPDTEHAYVDHDRDQGTYTLVEVHRDGHEKKSRLTPGSGKICGLTDIGMLSELRDLTLCMQPVTDVTPVFTLNNLEGLHIQYCPVTDLSGIENCTNLKYLELKGTRVQNIPYLGERETFSLSIYEPYFPVKDFDFCRDICSFEEFSVEGAEAAPVRAALSGKTVERLGLSESDIVCPADLSGIRGIKRLDICGCHSFCSLRGIEQWPELEYIHLAWCGSLVNLRPLLLPPELSVLEVGDDLYGLAKEQLRDAEFTIVREGEAP
ncbi:MAG: leucine-rich repeat domain-containing protein [Eubacteriales bacterium]|nr:leucine-rich repeat domain-containing protein [Eubacteriales bacterium]